MKAEIPCVDDLVGKLEDIGEKTKDKLANLAAAAETCGAHDLAFPFPSVTTGSTLDPASPQQADFMLDRASWLRCSPQSVMCSDWGGGGG